VLGNPPFVGKSLQDAGQKADMASVTGHLPSAGVLDFVAAWYIKAARYMAGHPSMRAAFVSTNSICQGEQVGALWGWLLAQGIKIHFAHRTFSWSNEARGKAAVHCIIVGFGLGDVAEKTIFEYEDIKGEAHAINAVNINPYLVDAPDIVLPNRSSPICNTPNMAYGSKPTDGGHYMERRDIAFG
jgi:type II restriction/modification system DNA methylase subunit YeeA